MNNQEIPQQSVTGDCNSDKTLLCKYKYIHNNEEQPYLWGSNVVLCQQPGMLYDKNNFKFMLFEMFNVLSQPSLETSLALLSHHSGIGATAIGNMSSAQRTSLAGSTNQGIMARIPTKPLGSMVNCIGLPWYHTK